MCLQIWRKKQDTGKQGIKLMEDRQKTKENKSKKKAKSTNK